VTNSVPWRPVDGGVALVARVTPNAGATRIEGIETRDDGSAVLRIRVSVPPDKGKANKAVVALLAEALGVSKSAISITAGETARQKTVHIAGNAEAIGLRLSRL